MRNMAIALVICAGVCWSGNVRAQLSIVVTPMGNSGCPEEDIVAACPCGEMDSFDVMVFEQPAVPTSVITVVMNGEPGVCICPGHSPQSKVEGPSGIVWFTFYHLGGHGGVSFSAETTTPGVEPVTSPMYLMKSPDINGDCVVNLIDFGIFGRDFMHFEFRSNYDCYGAVDMIDFARFTQHFLHWCPAEAPGSRSHTAHRRGRAGPAQ